MKVRNLTLVIYGVLAGFVGQAGADEAADCARYRIAGLPCPSAPSSTRAPVAAVRALTIQPTLPRGATAIVPSPLASSPLRSSPPGTLPGPIAGEIQTPISAPSALPSADAPMTKLVAAPSPVLNQVLVPSPSPPPTQSPVAPTPAIPKAAPPVSYTHLTLPTN